CSGGAMAFASGTRSPTCPLSWRPTAHSSMTRGHAGRRATCRMGAGPYTRRGCRRARAVSCRTRLRPPAWGRSYSDAPAGRPGVARPAVVWTIDLDSAAATVGVRVARALVRSRAKLGYPRTQADAETGRLPEPIALLPEIGRLLLERGLARGAINLPMPAQE